MMSYAQVTGELANQNLLLLLNLFIQQLEQQPLPTSTTLIPLVTNTTSSITSSSTTTIPISSNTNTTSQTVNNNNNNNTKSYLSYPITKRTSLSEIDQISNEVTNLLMTNQLKDKNYHFFQITQLLKGQPIKTATI